MRAALAASQAPVIYSHSSARALDDHPRNVPDDILRALAANGGVVMVNFAPGYVSAARNQWQADRAAEQTRYNSPPYAGLYIGQPDRAKAALAAWDAAHPRPVTTLAQVADHIEHIRQVAGIDHVGLGSDFDGIPDAPVGLEGVDRYPGAAGGVDAARLERCGYRQAWRARTFCVRWLRPRKSACSCAHRRHLRWRLSRRLESATLEKLGAWVFYSRLPFMRSRTRRRKYGPKPDSRRARIVLSADLEFCESERLGRTGAPHGAPAPAVTALARGLEHPRWLYVLPNGDVLVAESDAPDRPDDAKGITGAVAQFVMKRAGSGRPNPVPIGLPCCGMSRVTARRSSAIFSCKGSTRLSAWRSSAAVFMWRTAMICCVFPIKPATRKFAFHRCRSAPCRPEASIIIGLKV